MPYALIPFVPKPKQLRTNQSSPARAPLPCCQQARINFPWYHGPIRTLIVVHPPALALAIASAFFCAGLFLAYTAFTSDAFFSGTGKGSGLSGLPPNRTDCVWPRLGTEGGQVIRLCPRAFYCERREGIPETLTSSMYTTGFEVREEPDELLYVRIEKIIVSWNPGKEMNCTSFREVMNGELRAMSTVHRSRSERTRRTKSHILADPEVVACNMGHQFTYNMDDVPNVGYLWRLNKRELRYPPNKTPVEVIDFAVNDEEEVEEMGIKVDAESMTMSFINGTGKILGHDIIFTDLQTSQAQEIEYVETIFIESVNSNVPFP
ncbi:hypothetical protein B0H11DRAFT_1926559 [Mycena galericulata]|nr:hypothetical protein B0H11DRAFT_1926559 [Mycena galericulata]